MPFFEPSRSDKIVIDYDRYMPVAVICVYEADGTVTPMRFKYQEKDESKVTVNIDSISSRKNIRGGYSFACLATNYGRQQQVILNFYIDLHLWVMLKM